MNSVVPASYLALKMWLPFGTNG